MKIIFPKIFVTYYSIAIISLLFVSCEKFVDVGPPKTSLTTESIFANEGAALSAVAGLYFNLSNTGFSSGNNYESVTFLSGVSSDELINFDLSNKEEYYRNSIQSGSLSLNSLWTSLFKGVYMSNSVILGLSNSSSISNEVKSSLEGEALFIRAFCYFYLVNLFGDVPLQTTPDYLVNSKKPRAPSTQVYEQIIADLQKSELNLPSDYALFSGERTRATRPAAKALLARVYLYLNDWENAEIKATEVITNSSLFSLDNNLNNVFLKNSGEAIWQLQPINSGLNTWEGFYFILQDNPAISQAVTLSDDLVNSFQPGDLRKQDWINSYTDGVDTWYFPFKYKVRIDPNLTEYSMVLRFAEQYLIRAEARAQQNKLAEAAGDIDIIRDRAELSLIAATNPSPSQSDLLLAIEQERRVELFSEWGHRWFDLKRTGRSTDVLGPVKAPNWEATDTLYPIPQNEIKNNNNIVQNNGYN